MGEDDGDSTRDDIRQPIIVVSHHSGILWAQHVLNALDDGRRGVTSFYPHVDSTSLVMEFRSLGLDSKGGPERER